MAALVFPEVTRRLPRSSTAISVLRVRYPDGRGILRRLLQVATSQGFAIDELSTDAERQRLGPDRVDGEERDGRTVEVTMQLHGPASVNDLAAALSELADVGAVVAGDANAISS